MHLKYKIVRICLLWEGMFGNVKDGFLKHARYERYKTAPSPKLRDVGNENLLTAVRPYSATLPSICQPGRL